MTKSRVNADNVTADIAGITAGTGITGGGTSGTVTITNDMATTIAAKGDILAGTANDAYSALTVGANGTVLTAASGQATGLEWATPATGALTWTQRLAGTGITIYSIAYNGTNLYVAAGSAGNLYTSPTGTTWTARTSGFGANAIYNVSFGNGLWVAVGANGTITTSTDGTTWTARTANMSTNEIYNVVYANSLWVAVGDGGGTNNTGGITYSTDGTTWTRKSQTPTIGDQYYTVVYNGTNWIVGGAFSTNNYLYASAPSGTWTAGATGIGGHIGLILWDGTRHIVAQDTLVSYSTSNTLGTTTNYSNIASINGSEATKQYFQLYSNLLYRFTMAMQTFVPVSTAYPSLSVPVLLPTTAINSAGTSFTQGIQTAFVGAAGIIIVGGSGRLYTSF